MNKRFISWIVVLVLIFCCSIPTSANGTVMFEKENLIDSKQKYIDYIEENQEQEHQIIVKFKDGMVSNISKTSNNNIDSKKFVSHRDIAISTIEKSNLTKQCSFERTIENSNISIFKATSNNIENVLETLNNDENVLYAQEDYKVIAAEKTPEIKQWAIQNSGQTVDRSTGENGFDINLLEAWSVTNGSEDVVVGVIDTGIDIYHQDLQNNIWRNTDEIQNGIDDDGNGYIDDINGWDFVSDDNTVYDMDALDEHGTHMAGIIAANGNISGVAPNVKIMPLKALNYSSGYTSDIIEAIQYARVHGVRIINCSFASIQYNPALEEAIASNSDMLFVCAAGNYGQPTTEIATFPACYDLDNIITISAANNKGQLSEISSYGDYVDASAPGIGIYSTLPENNYGFKDGTSCSAAFVSGVAALLLSYNNDLSVKAMKNKIINSCGSSLPKQTENGNATPEGMINVALALCASENIGKCDDFEYSSALSEDASFNKYPFEFINENGNIKVRFDSNAQIQNFDLKIYESTEEKEHTYLVNSNIQTNVDYILTGMLSNTDYDIAIKITTIANTTEYSGKIKYVIFDGLEYVDIDILSEQSYDNVPIIPINDTIFYTAEDKDAIMETLSAGTKNEVESNNTMNLADRTYDDYDTYGYMNSVTDVDYFKVKFNNDGVANFWLGNIPNGHDYDLYIYDEGGTLLAQSRKSDSEAELIPYLPVESGVFYYMKVESYSGSNASSPYLLRTKWYETPSNYENNDTISNAYVLPGYTSNTITEKISSESDVDYYKVSVPRKSILEIKLTRPNNHFRFNVYTASNTNQPIISPTGNTCMQEVNSGTYYILIYTTSGYSTNNYTLKVNCNPLYTIGVEDEIVGEMAATNNVYYKLNISSAVGIQMDLSDFGSSDYDIYLYDAEFSEIISSTGTTTSETMQSVLQDGTYLIRVRRYDGTNLNFTIETSVVMDSNDAYLTTANFPTEMKVNDVKAVTVLATNEGARTWTASDGYKLAALNQSTSFVAGDRLLSSSDRIGNGQSKSFIFNIIAPEVSSVTTYTTGWQMKLNSLSFGNKITKLITVKPECEELTLNSFVNVSGKPTNQLYEFNVTSAGNYAIRTFHYSTASDTMLSLYDSSMTEISSNDDIYSGNRYSRIEKYLTPGTYYIELSEYNDKPIYCQLVLENFTTNTISMGSTVSVSNKYEGYYKFNVTSSGDYIIGTKYYSQNSDTYLVLYDSEFAATATRIAYNNDDSSNYARIVAHLNSGTYYVRVTTYDYMINAERKKVYSKLSVTKQSSTPSTENAASINITYPSNNSVVRLYDGDSLKISGTISNVNNVVVTVNGHSITGVRKTGNKFEGYYKPNESNNYVITVTGNAMYGGNNPSDSVNVTLLVNDDGDTLDTATSIKEGTERVAAIDYPEDIDCFMFVPQKSDMYSICTTGTTDTVINIYNELYALNAYNDDDFTHSLGTNAEVPIYLNSNQIYYIMVHSAIQNSTGKYNLCINRLYDDNPNVKTITRNNAKKGKIDYPEDEDVFAFYPDVSGTYTFKTIGNSDVMGVVYDNDGNYMDFNDDIGQNNTNCQITVQLEAGNVYYVVIKSDFSYMYKQSYQVIVE